MKQNKRLVNFLFCFILSIFIFSQTKAQNTFVGDVILITQAEVDAFGLNNYTEITGDLAIGVENNSITNLLPLSTLTTIGGYLVIKNNELLTNLDGLGNITTIGFGLYLSDNSLLDNMDGLLGISSVDVLNIAFNSVLTNLDGLLNISSVITLQIYSNPLLVNIDGLRNISIVGLDLEIIDNTLLTNLDGLTGITSVARNLGIVYNLSLTNFCGLFPLLNSGGLTGLYEVEDNLTNPTQADIINNCGSFSVDSKIYLEGSYNTVNGNMNNTLTSIPLNSPYSEDPKTVGSIPVNVVDWVLVQLRDKLNTSTIVASRSSFILTNGKIVDIDGTSPVLFPEIAIEYFLSVRHRNHLSAMSKETIN